jgi:lysozyme
MLGLLALPIVRKILIISCSRKLALIDMAFNLGMKGLLKFTHFLLSMEAGDYQAASRQMLESLWAEQVGYRAIELAEMIKEG